MNYFKPTRDNSDMIRYIGIWALLLGLIVIAPVVFTLVLFSRNPALVHVTGIFKIFFITFGTAITILIIGFLFYFYNDGKTKDKKKIQEDIKKELNDQWITELRSDLNKNLTDEISKLAETQMKQMVNEAISEKTKEIEDRVKDELRSEDMSRRCHLAEKIIENAKDKIDKDILDKVISIINASYTPTQGSPGTGDVQNPPEQVPPEKD